MQIFFPTHITKHFWCQVLWKDHKLPEDQQDWQKGRCCSFMKKQVLSMFVLASIAHISFLCFEHLYTHGRLQGNEGGPFQWCDGPAKSAAKGNEQRSWQRSFFLFEASYQCSVELEDKFLSSMDGSMSWNVGVFLEDCTKWATIGQPKLS